MDDNTESNTFRIKLLRSLALIIPILIIIIVTAGFTCHLASASEINDSGNSIDSNITLKTIVVVAGAPYSFINDKGQPDGFSVDLMQAVAQVMGFKIESRADIWDNARQALENGEVDFLPLVAYSTDRDKVFDFTPPHTIIYDAFFTRKGERAIHSMDELEGKTIIVLKGDQAQNYLMSLGTIKNEQIIQADTLPDGLRLLASGKGDVILMPKMLGVMFIRDLNLINIDESPAVVEDYNRPWSFAVKEGNQELLERLNQGLIIVKNTGQYDEIYQKWFGTLEPPEPSSTNVLKYLGGIVLVFSLIGAILLLWSFSLKKQVASRTRSLEMEMQERRLVGESLRKTNEYLDNLINYANAPIIIWDTEFLITRFNHAFEYLTGRKAQDVIGKSLTILFPPDSVESSMELIRKTSSGQRWESVEIDILHLDGSIKTVLWNSATIFAPDTRTPIATIAQGQDITERKQAEDLIRMRLELLEFASSHTLDEILQTTLDKIGTLTNSPVGFYHFINSDQKTLSLQAWSTRTIQEFCQVTDRDTHYPIEQAGVWVDCVYTKKPIIHNDYASLPHRKGLPKGHAPVIRELVVPILRDEKIVAILGVGNKPIDYNQKDVTLVTHFADVAWEIAELKQIEEELNQTLASLKRSNEELKQFAYIASHDLQEPLRMISSYLQLIERRYKGQLDKDADEFIAFAVDGANRLQAMITGLLAYSRVETKGNPFEIVEFSEILAKVILNLKVAIEESGAVITNDELPAIAADGSQFIQVFQNLILNSIKFKSSDPPQIQICAKPVSEKEGSIMPDVWLFSVKDNGIGIDPKYKDRLFNIFQRISREEYPGVGIGLSVCKRIVERHGGHIWLESEIGKGTTFYFTIPIKEIKHE